MIPGMQGIREMSIDAMGTHPTSGLRPWVTGRPGPPRPDRLYRPPVSHHVHVRSVDTCTSARLYSLFYSIYSTGYSMGMPLCFYVLGAFLPAIPGWCRDADPRIKSPPAAQYQYTRRNLTGYNSHIL